MACTHDPIKICFHQKKRKRNKTKNTQNLKPPHLSLDFGTTKETPSSITLELFFIENTKTKRQCVCDFCVYT
jgi:hypothetical protein